MENESLSNSVIGVYDSGLGGLSVLRELKKVLPEASFVYYADTAYCPYGEKSPEFIVDRARAVTGLLRNEGAEVIVIACNTATSAAISTLRQEYDMPFVGMEPAVKPAARVTRTGVVGVLATAGTLAGDKYRTVKGRYSDDVLIVESVGQGYVELVENSPLAEPLKSCCRFLTSAKANGGRQALDGRSSFISDTPALDAHTAGCSSGRITSEQYLSQPALRQTVRRSLAPLIEAGADTVVLGCTHYPFLLPALESEAAELLKEHPLVALDSTRVEKINFIDPAPAVAHRLLQVLDELHKK